MYEDLLEENLTKGEAAATAESVDAAKVLTCVRQATRLLRTVDLGIPSDRPFDAPHGRGWLAKQRTRLAALTKLSQALPAPSTSETANTKSATGQQQQQQSRQTLFAGGNDPGGTRLDSQQRTQRMEDTCREMSEMLDVGSSILDNLNSQGATIERNKERIAQVDGQLSTGEQLMKKMKQWWRQ